MREIKFRAWDNKRKEWLLGYELPNLGGFSLIGETVLLGEWSKILDKFLFEREGYEFIDLKVMQFTGLKDKNGVEIYEDDILKHDEHWDSGRTITVASMTVPFYCGDWSIESDECEVIGNIYQNPELLQ